MGRLAGARGGASWRLLGGYERGRRGRCCRREEHSEPVYVGLAQRRGFAQILGGGRLLGWWWRVRRLVLFCNDGGHVVAKDLERGEKVGWVGQTDTHVVQVGAGGDGC